MPTRYDRQILLFGEEGQRKLRDAKVGIAGCGGLGTTVVTQLASAGIGYMMVVDGDVPDITNLNRQFVFREGQDRNKADLLSEWACEVNPETMVDYYEGEITDFTIGPLFDQCDILVDCLDTMESRKLLNAYAVSTGKVLVHAGVTGYTGQVTVVVPGKTPDLGSLYRDVRDHEGAIPSIGPMVSMMASIEATQVIQVATGTGSPFIGKLAAFDFETGSFEVIDLS